MVAFLCLAALVLAALVLAALMPGAAGLALAFLVATICFFGTISLIVLLPWADAESHSQQVLALAAFSPRPPPAL